MIFLNSISSLKYQAKNLANQMFCIKENQELLNQLNKQEIKLLVKSYQKSCELSVLVKEFDLKFQRRKKISERRNSKN